VFAKKQRFWAFLQKTGRMCVAKPAAENISSTRREKVETQMGSIRKLF